MEPNSLLGVFFWGFLLAYGVLMFALSPRAVTLGGFVIYRLHRRFGATGLVRAGLCPASFFASSSHREEITMTQLISRTGEHITRGNAW
jgi:hypothetical protein